MHFFLHVIPSIASIVSMTFAFSNEVEGFHSGYTLRYDEVGSIVFGDNFELSADCGEELCDFSSGSVSNLLPFSFSESASSERRFVVILLAFFLKSSLYFSSCSFPCSQFSIFCRHSLDILSI